MQLAPTFLGEKEYQKGRVWLIFPDLKECELAKTEWAGKRYQEATFSTIEAVTNYLATGANNNDNGGGGYDAPWGENLMSGLSKIMGGKDGDAGLLGDRASLDPLVEGENSPAKLWLVIQPGNGGPVEDWVNCEKMALASPDTTMVVINGALDKVRGGFYPAVFFPKLAATVDRFWKKFEPAFYLKPFSDKGVRLSVVLSVFSCRNEVRFCSNKAKAFHSHLFTHTSCVYPIVIKVYGWLYRVYPEPWQVHLEIVKPGKDGNAEVEYVLVDALDQKPSYDKVVSMLLKASQANK
jgi:hypothetical protein